MKKIVTIHYVCEICQRMWNSESQALICESSPPPALRVGDIVLWRGRRDGGVFQTLVYDTVIAVHTQIHQGEPGHQHNYQLDHDYSVQEKDIQHPQTGYVNIAGRIGTPGHHADRVEVAYRIDDASTRTCEVLVTKLIESHVPLHRRIACLYPSIRSLEYSHTWTQELFSSQRGTREQIVYRLNAWQSEVLQFLSRKISPNECLHFLGGYKYHAGRTVVPYPSLDDAFTDKRYRIWSGMVLFRLKEAFSLLASASDEALIEAVYTYREALLRGDASYKTPDTLQALFPLDETKAVGKWSKALLHIAAEQGILGSGKTRLRRLYDKTLGYEEKKAMPCQDDTLRLWIDRRVIAIMSGKGGVGKSTVTADLARALSKDGKRILVVDIDFTGPSQPLFFPVEEARLRTENGKLLPHVVDGVQVISLGHLLESDEPVLWRGPYLEMLLHLLGTTVETDAEIVLLDLPPGTGDVFQSVLHFCPHASFVVVATAGEVALADVRRSIAALSGRARSQVIGVIENMAYKEFPDPIGRVAFWGNVTDVPTFASDSHLRYLGALPMADQTIRIEEIRKWVLPALLDCLAGHRFQQIALSSLPILADQILEEYTASLGALTWGLDTVALLLEAKIIQLGGNPDDDRYIESLRNELWRVWRVIGTCLLVHKVQPPLSEKWWWCVVSKAQAWMNRTDEQIQS